jgi:hypothetical protein
MVLLWTPLHSSIKCGQSTAAAFDELLATFPITIWSVSKRAFGKSWASSLDSQSFALILHLKLQHF